MYCTGLPWAGVVNGRPPAMNSSGNHGSLIKRRTIALAFRELSISCPGGGGNSVNWIRQRDGRQLTEARVAEISGCASRNRPRRCSMAALQPSGGALPCCWKRLVIAPLPTLSSNSLTNTGGDSSAVNPGRNDSAYFAASDPKSAFRWLSYRSGPFDGSLIGGSATSGVGGEVVPGGTCGLPAGAMAAASSMPGSAVDESPGVWSPRWLTVATTTPRPTHAAKASQADLFKSNRGALSVSPVDLLIAAR